MRRTTSPVYARSKIWLDLNGRVALSEWRIQLLEAVGEAGSLAAAAGPGRPLSHRLV